MISLETDIQKRMAKLKRAMGEASNGKQLKRQVSKRLRTVIQPLVQEQKLRVLRLPSKGGHSQGLRQAVARQTRAATKWSGKNVGVQVIQRARAMPRDFRFAGRALNRAEGWHPTTLGGEVVHQQARPVEWFDAPVSGARKRAQQEVRTALKETAAKIASGA